MFRTLLTLAFAAALAGCGDSDDGPLRAPVRGTVTLDGAPLDGGTITFIPTGDNVGPATGTTIENGAYRLGRDDGPLVGPNRVQISAIRPTGKLVAPLVAPETDGPVPELVEELADVVPDRYNRGSELVRDVRPDEVNEFDFTLESEDPVEP